MNSGVKNWVLLATVGVFINFASLGCFSNTSTTSAVARETSNIKTLVILYGMYTARSGGMPPQSEEAFKKYIEGLSEGQRKGMRISNTEQLFTSPRDGYPYVVRYSNSSGDYSLGSQPIVAYEQEGVNGKRYAGTLLGTVQELDEDFFADVSQDASAK